MDILKYKLPLSRCRGAQYIVAGCVLCAQIWQGANRQLPALYHLKYVSF
jgi:hypothetical protein